MPSVCRRSTRTVIGRQSQRLSLHRDRPVSHVCSHDDVTGHNKDVDYKKKTFTADPRGRRGARVACESAAGRAQRQTADAANAGERASRQRQSAGCLCYFHRGRGGSCMYAFVMCVCVCAYTGCLCVWCRHGCNSKKRRECISNWGREGVCYTCIHIFHLPLLSMSVDVNVCI